MIRYWHFIVAILLAAGTFAIVYVVQSRRHSAGDQRHSWVSYLLLWPLILDADKSKRAGRFLTRREWSGWAVVGLLIATGMLISAYF